MLNRQPTSPHRLSLLAVLSLLLALILVTGVSAASLGVLVNREGFEAAREDFLSAEKAARQSGEVGARITGAGFNALGTPLPPISYASDRMKIFSLANGELEIYGFAGGSSAGILAARFNPATVRLSTSPKGTRLNGDSGFYVIIYYLGTNAQNQDVFQVNLYDRGNVLQDDRYVFTRPASSPNTTR